VIIEQHLDGEIKICLGNHYLNYKVLPERPKKIIDLKLTALTVKKQISYKPPANHHWRKQFIYTKAKPKHQIININN